MLNFLVAFVWCFFLGASAAGLRRLETFFLVVNCEWCWSASVIKDDTLSR